MLPRARFCLSPPLNISTTEAALTTFHAYFMSRATYAILVWGASSHANRVFIQQKEAIRAVAGSSYRSSCRELFKSLKVLTIPSIYILTAVLYVHNHRHRFPLRSTIHQYHTRNTHQLEIPRHRLVKTQKTPSYMAIKLYNSLPPHLKELSSNVLRSNLRRILLENAPYNIEEFKEKLE